MTTTSRSWLPSYIDSRITRRRFLKASAAGAGGAALIACGSGGGGGSIEVASSSREPGSVWLAKNDWTLEDETKQAVRGGVYRGFMTDDQTGHFDAISLMSSQVPFSQHVHEMLMARNRGPGIDPASLESSVPVGALAESWEIAPDNTTITFTMRQNVKWQDIAPVSGREVDMDDWKTSFERHLELGVYRNAIGDILDRVEYPDDTHMVWKLGAPYAPIFERIWHDKFGFPIQAKELNASSQLAEGSPIGTGYKILDSHQPAIAMEYRKNPEYWGGDPFIERWHQPIIPEYANRYSQFVTGNITDFPPTARDVLIMHNDAPEAVIVAAPISDESVSRYRWGRETPAEQPWADPRVRVAARRSIDFQKIGEFLSNKVEFERSGIAVELLTQTHMPTNPAYWLDPVKGELGALSENYLYNPEEALKLVKAAGFEAPIPMDYPIQLSGGEIAEENQLVLDSFKATGTFDLKVERVPGRQAGNKYRIEGRFDGLLGWHSTGTGIDYVVMRDMHKNGRVGSRGLQNQAYPDARMDDLGDAQRGEMDPEKRLEILRDIQHLQAEIFQFIPSRHRFTTFSFRWPWVHNLGYGTNGGSPPNGRAILGGHLHWLDETMPNRDRT